VGNCRHLWVVGLACVVSLEGATAAAWAGITSGLASVGCLCATGEDGGMLLLAPVPHTQIFVPQVTFLELS